MKKLIVIAVIVVLVVAAFLIYRGIASAAEQEATFDVQPSMDVITKGDITLSVSASGNLGSAETFDIEADSYLAIEAVLVDEGDTMDAGQAVATLDTEAMQAYADDLAQEIMTKQTSIDTTNNVTTTLSIKSPSDGWVKNVMLDDDDYIEDAMQEYGYVALVATEERELVNADESGLAEGDEVRVKCEGYWNDGVVTSEKEGLHISIDTVKRTVGADAIVYDTDGNEFFTGQIELAAYDVIESSYGIISDVKFSEDEEIEQGETIYKASQYSISVVDLYESVADLKEEYETIVGLIDSAEITTPSAGVVSSVAIRDGQECTEGTALMSIESTDAWTAVVSVDELDINAIEVGQSVDVELDSVPNAVFEGVVNGISDKGTASGGITTYDVDVSVEDNEGFKLAMTLNCEIMAQEAIDAVLAPIDDVRTANTQSYVMVAVQRTDDEITAIKQLILDNDNVGLIDYMGEDVVALNIRMLSDPVELLYAEVRAVETGIQNAFYVEITSGLSVDESVLQPISSETDSANSFMQGMQGMQGMTRPEGMTKPSGGQRD